MDLDSFFFLASGDLFLESDMRFPLSNIYELIRNSKRKILIFSYSLTENAFFLIDLLIEKSKNDIEVILLLDKENLESNDLKLKLNELKSNFFSKVYIYVGKYSLHTKLIIIDSMECLLGSFNLSGRGLYYNNELGIYLKGNVISDFEEKLLYSITSGLKKKIIKIY